MRTVYPVGTTLYKPSQCWNGYTLLWRGRTPKLIDMNGRTVHEWQCDAGGIEHGVSRARLWGSAARRRYARRRHGAGGLL